MVDATASAYVLIGLRAEIPRRQWKATGSASFGNGFSNEEGQWFLGDVAANRNWSGSSVGFALNANGFGLHYTNPFQYTAYAGELNAPLTWRKGALQLTATPRGTGGFWQSDTIDGDIRVVGGTVQLSRVFGSLTVGLAAEAHDADNGALSGMYRGIGAEASASFGTLDLGGSVKRWENPIASEWGYSAFLAKSVTQSFAVHIQIARSVTDPVLASPGSFGASLGASWRVLSGSRSTPKPVVQVGRARSQGRVVVFTVESDRAAVALSGSFTEWTPVPMRRNGRNFTLELVVAPGTHQYGFVLDGTEWHVPRNAFGIVDDGFGRKNATLVVEQ